MWPICNGTGLLLLASGIRLHSNSKLPGLSGQQVVLFLKFFLCGNQQAGRVMTTGVFAKRNSPVLKKKKGQELRRHPEGSKMARSSTDPTRASTGLPSVKRFYALLNSQFNSVVKRGGRSAVRTEQRAPSCGRPSLHHPAATTRTSREAVQRHASNETGSGSDDLSEHPTLTR